MRRGAWLSVGLAVLGAACSATTATTTSATTTLAPTTTTTPRTTTSSPEPSSTSTIAGTGLLHVFPSEGRPGDPLVICGWLRGGSQVRVTLYDPASWFVWPEETDEFTNVDESGQWCWTGTIPRELENTEPGFQGERRPILSRTHEIRLETFGNILDYARLTVDASGESEGPSQSPADARRDGVVAAAAELPFSLRVEPLVEVPGAEGTWVLSRLSEEVMEATGAAGCRFGETDGTTPEEVINTTEYGEILLVDETGAIVRAYPMPAAIPSWILVTWDAVYAGRVGDGALPDSTLVRIDRRTLEAEVVLVLTGEFYGYGVWPHSWRIATTDQAAAYAGLVGSPDDVTGLEAESRVGPIAVDLAGVDRFLAGFRFGVEQVDLAERYGAAPEATMSWQVRLPWGSEPGQVGYSADFGPCCLEVLADGSPVVLDGQRLQVWDGGTWRVFYQVGGDHPALADGIAALDSGLIAVPTYPAPSERGMLLLDLDGNIVSRGEALREANNGWWGGEDLWAVLGMPPFTRWARITHDGALIPIAEQAKVDAFSNSALTFQMAYDRRGDYDTAYNITTVTIEAAEETRQWLLYGGDVAGAARFALLDDGILGVWIAGSDYLIVTMRPDLPVGVARIPLNQWVQTATFGFFRVHENRLYLLQTYRDGARIEVYDLP